MKQRIRDIGKWIKNIGFFVPVTWYFVLFAIGITIGWQWLKGKEQTPDSPTAAIFELIVKVALWFSVALLVLAFVSVLVSFVYFWYKKRKQGVDFRINTQLTEKQLQQKQIIGIHISPILKPLMGFVKLRLQYDDVNLSPKFSLVETEQQQLISTTIEGNYNWALPEIKEYNIERSILYFEDFFQFFSFAINLKSNNRFFTQPADVAIKDIKTFPRKTEETNIRIEEMRKVEGEYLNYKNFENNDDVRRIVWKIYAKNKELVVRMPEVLDPYASHIYLYASFFTQFEVVGNSAAEIPFLNYFKTMLWATYQQLTKQGFEVRYVPDQPTPSQGFANEQQAVKYAISTANWQTGKDLKTYCKTNEAAMLLVHSFSNATEVAELAERFGNDITIVFVKLSDSLKQQNVFTWLQWLFIQNEKTEVERYRTAWSLSLLRSKVLDNEKKLTSILKRFEKPVMI